MTSETSNELTIHVRGVAPADAGTYARAGKTLVSLDHYTDKILRVSFSYDGKFLASIGQDRLIVCDTQDWKPIPRVKGPFPTATYLPLSFSPTEHLLAAATRDDPTSVELIRVRG